MLLEVSTACMYMCYLEMPGKFVDYASKREKYGRRLPSGH